MKSLQKTGRIKKRLKKKEELDTQETENYFGRRRKQNKNKHDRKKRGQNLGHDLNTRISRGKKGGQGTGELRKSG